MTLSTGENCIQHTGDRPLEDLGADVSIKTQRKEKGSDGAEWINVAQGRDTWRVLVTTTMNLRVLHNAGNILTR